MSWLLKVVVLAIFACIASVSAEFVQYKTCPGFEDDCQIGQVNIDPCPDALENKACRIKRRGTTKITFDYTPKFAADTLEVDLVWVKSTDQELPLAGMDHDACKFTTCPVLANEKSTYSMNVPIDKKFPTASYLIKWMLKEANGKQCCFTTDITVVRR